MADLHDAHADKKSDAKTKRRRHFIDDLPTPSEIAKKRPWHRRPLVLAGGCILLLITLPAAAFAWNILRPDEAVPAKIAPPDYLSPADPAAPDASTLADAAELIARARVSAGIIGTLPDSVSGDAAVLAGRVFDPVKTPRFLDAYAVAVERTAPTSAEAISRAVRAPFRESDLLLHDGMLRARAAHARAARDPESLAETHAERLTYAGALIDTAATPEAFKAALRHEREVLAEIRDDDTLLASGGEELKKLLETLLARSLAPSPTLAASVARAFDAALDEKPDDGLLAMKAPAPESPGTFLRLALLSRRPNAHRREVSTLLRRFGDALAKPTFVEARAALSAPGEYKTIRFATLLLRDRVLDTCGDGIVTRYFFTPGEKPSEGLETFVLRTAALYEADDIYGETLLLRRRAILLGLIADRDRTRFDAGATIIDLAVEHRRQKTGVRPKDSSGLLDGLSETYPLDPFTDEPPAYSRRRADIHSPGADGVNTGGIAEPQFASELELLWEPTVSLDHETPPDPAAFGLKPEAAGATESVK